MHQEKLYSSETTTLGNSLANGHCHVGNELVPHYFFLSLRKWWSSHSTSLVLHGYSANGAEKSHLHIPQGSKDQPTTQPSFTWRVVCRKVPFSPHLWGSSPQNFFWPSVTLNNFLPNVEAAYSASKNPWCGVNHYVHSRESFFAFFPTVVPPTSFVSHGLVNRDAESWCSLKKELESSTWWDRWPPEMQMMGIMIILPPVLLCPLGLRLTDLHYSVVSNTDLDT